MRVLIMPLCSESVSIKELVRCIDSIVEQEDHPFMWSMKVMCNTNNLEYLKSVRLVCQDKKNEVVHSESNGGNGKGHNAVLDYYRSVYEKEGYTHLMMIDADDFYYPCAFSCIDEISQLIDFDYLSNMQITDSVRCHETYQSHLPVIPGVWLHSNFNMRFPIPSYIYYDGWNCSGGEVTLCISSRAVECDLRHMEVPNIPDDFAHMLYAVKSHVEKKLLFVNTDCNDVYIYDKTNPVGTTNQPEFTFDPDGWPETERELLRGNTFASVRGLNRQQLPWITIPQVMDPAEKVAFIKNNLINKGQFKFTS